MYSLSGIAPVTQKAIKSNESWGVAYSLSAHVWVGSGHIPSASSTTCKDFPPLFFFFDQKLRGIRSLWLVHLDTLKDKPPKQCVCTCLALSGKRLLIQHFNNNESQCSPWCTSTLYPLRDSAKHTTSELFILPYGSLFKSWTLALNAKM